MVRKSADWVPERGDMIYINHSPQAGAEMPGEHPLLVCSTKRFHERTNIVIGFPMTHADYNKDNPFAVPVKGPRNQIGYVLTFRPKSFDWRERRARAHPWGGGHNDVLLAALEQLDSICGICQA